VKEGRGLILKMQRKGNGKERKEFFLGEAIPSTSGVRDSVLGLCEMKANKKCRRLRCLLYPSVTAGYEDTVKKRRNKQRLELRRQKAGFVSIWMSCVCVSVHGLDEPIKKKIKER